MRRFVRLPGSVDEAFLMLDVTAPANDQERWAHPNRLGPTALVSDASGAAVETHAYAPYGAPGAAGPGGFPYRFTGQRLDPESGLYFYKARYYDPELGRFLQTDPIGYADQMNLYAYVGNDPVNWVDPWGLANETITSTCEDHWANCGGGRNQYPDNHFAERFFRLFTWSPGHGKREAEKCSTVGDTEEIHQEILDGDLTYRAVAEATAVGVGASDALTFGLFSKAMSQTDLGATVGATSRLTGYQVGVYGSAGVGAGRLTYASGVAAIRSSGMTGAQAVATRNWLKGVFSVLGSRHPKAHSYSAMLAKYGTDDAVIAAASRSNAGLNALGGNAVVGSGAVWVSGGSTCAK